MHHPSHRRAFTLIELLVVIAIIGILATLIIVSVGTSQAKARVSTIKSNVAEVGKGIELYKINSASSLVPAPYLVSSEDPDYTYLASGCYYHRSATNPPDYCDSSYLKWGNGSHGAFKAIFAGIESQTAHTLAAKVSSTIYSQDQGYYYIVDHANSVAGTPTVASDSVNGAYCFYADLGTADGQVNGGNQIVGIMNGSSFSTPGILYRTAFGSIPPTWNQLYTIYVPQF